MIKNDNETQPTAIPTASSGEIFMAQLLDLM